MHLAPTRQHNQKRTLLATESYNCNACVEQQARLTKQRRCTHAALGSKLTRMRQRLRPDQCWGTSSMRAGTKTNPNNVPTPGTTLQPQRVCTCSATAASMTQAPNTACKRCQAWQCLSASLTECNLGAGSTGKNDMTRVRMDDGTQLKSCLLQHMCCFPHHEYSDLADSRLTAQGAVILVSSSGTPQHTPQQM